MKKLAAVIFCVFVVTQLIAQPTKRAKHVEHVDTSLVYEYCEEMPIFPDGMTAMNNFIKKNLVYPSQAVKDSIEGKVVVEFVVKYTGAIERIKVKKSHSPDLDAAALDVVKKMPAWIPGTQNKQHVSVKVQLPILFRLNEL